MDTKKKRRLDQIIQERMPQYSRQQIQSWIMQGRAIVDGIAVAKSGQLVAEDAKIAFDVEEPQYVSRAGFKLEKALDTFGIDVHNLVALDAGISTGGFTDCLLQRGIKKVYGIDVGYGQVHEKIRNDPRVVLLERTNLRALQTVGELIDLITLDLSFISVLKVMESVDRLLSPHGQLIILIKPQFEAGRHDVGRGGIVKDATVHQRVIEQVTNGVQKYGFELIGVVESPIKGSTGNVEFLAYFRRNNKKGS